MPSSWDAWEEEPMASKHNNEHTTDSRSPDEDNDWWKNNDNSKSTTDNSKSSWDDKKWDNNDKWGEKDENDAWNDNDTWDKKKDNAGYGKEWDKENENKDRKDWQLTLEERTALDKEDEKACEDLEICTEKVHIIKGGDLECWDTWEKCREGMPGALVNVMTDGRVSAFEKPTTIQSYVWPALMKQEDFMGIAKTGSGKTLAYLIPAYIACKIADPTGEGPEQPICLVLAPTRELVKQISKESEKFGNPAKINTCVCYGGEKNRREQLDDILYKRPHVLVSTPGRLVDYLNKGDFQLDTCRIAILDEADRMLDMGFEWDVRSIMDHLPQERQSLLFSATFPASVRDLAYKFTFRDAIHIQIGSTDPLTGNKDIFQEVKFVDDIRSKENELYKMITEKGWDSDSYSWKDAFKMLVFCKSKKSCAELARRFNDWKIPAVELHGDLGQWQREKSLDDFSCGEARLLFATDVASRGLDIPDVTAVVNFNPADSRETHVHRIGRTGRAGKKGLAYTFLENSRYDSELWAAADIVATMKKTGQEIPDDLLAIAREHGGGFRNKRY